MFVLITTAGRLRRVRRWSDIHFGGADAQASATGGSRRHRKNRSKKECDTSIPHFKLPSTTAAPTNKDRSPLGISHREPSWRGRPRCRLAIAAFLRNPDGLCGQKWPTHRSYCERLGIVQAACPRWDYCRGG